MTRITSGNGGGEPAESSWLQEELSLSIAGAHNVTTRKCDFLFPLTHVVTACYRTTGPMKLLCGTVIAQIG